MFNTSCSKTGEDSILLIPKGFQGTLVIIFNQGYGASKEYNNQGERVYRIPNSGVLKTNFAPNRGTSLLSLYSYSKNNSLEKLPIIYTFDELNKLSNQVVGYNPRIGAKVERYTQSDVLIKTYPPYLDLIVGSMSSIDSLSKYRDDFIFENIFRR